MSVGVQMAPVASDASHGRRFRAAPGVRLALLSALASLALTAALLAISADEARAHNDNRAAYHDETSPLHEAAAAGDLDSVNHFITVHGADVNVKDDLGQTPLLGPAWNGHVSIVAALIAAGVNVNVGDNSGYTPLFNAFRNGHVSIVDALIAAGANVNVKYPPNGHTLLHIAAGRGHVSTVAALIAARADVNVTNRIGSTPLHIAASSGHVSVVAALIAAGADVNVKMTLGGTPLHIAADSGHVSVVAALIAAGADVNAKTGSGRTPLHIAASSGHVSVVAALIAAGADVNAKAGAGITPLLDAFRNNSAARNDHVSVVTALIAAGGNWGEACENENVVNPAGPSPPCVAAAACASPSVRNAGTNRCDCPAPNIGTDEADAPGDCHVESALLDAANAGELDSVNHLITVHMADMNVTNSLGETPLRLAANNHHVSVVSALIAAGGHWGEACENAAIVNPTGPSPPCLCESPNVKTNLGACEVVAACAPPSVLNTNKNRCDCPAPNIGTDEADAPGDCACPAGSAPHGGLCIPKSGDFGELSDKFLCNAFGGTVRMATGGEVCSKMDKNNTFCILDSTEAFPCRGLFKHLRKCNMNFNRKALNPFFCGEKCVGAEKAAGARCEQPPHIAASGR